MLVLNGIAGRPVFSTAAHCSAGAAFCRRGHVFGARRSDRWRRITAKGLHRLIETIEHRFEPGIRSKGLAPNPRLGRARAERQRHDADGRFDFLLQFAGEKIADRRKGRHGFRTAHLPLTTHAALRFVGLRCGAGKHANQRIIGGGDLPFFVRHAGEILHLFRHGEIHVGLAGGEPDFADKHVVELHRLRRARTGDGERPSFRRGFQRLKIHTPIAGAIRLARHFLTGEFNGHVFAVLRRAPHRQAHPSLQNHLAGERTGGLHLGKQ